MSLDHYVTLGRTGLRVSPFCLGTMTFGEDWGFGSSPKEAQSVLARYLARGGNFVDTANVYTKGHSEKIIGDFLHKKLSRRDRLVLATKFFGTLYGGDPNAGGAGRKSLIAACEQSLRRLRTDYIDLYWMHAWDPLTPIEETLRGLDDLVRTGKIRYVGFSDTPAWKCAQAQTLAQLRGWSPLAALQIEYSLLERTVEGELIPMARELGLGVTPWSPLKFGILTGRFTRADRAKPADTKRGAWVSGSLDDRAYDVVDVLVAVAKELGVSPAQAALAWVQGRPGVSSTIIGARTLKQLDDNLGALAVTLTAAQRGKLDEVSKPKLNFPHDFLKNSGSFSSGGTTINGVTNPPTPMMPKTEVEVY
jgi:aryl-alcohol dehydrogenase-like predicted oxidoreductase